MYGQAWGDLQITPPKIAWQMLRGLRHEPPGNAIKDDRKKTFNAALEQAEQLFEAAGSVGTATRPILAFYGISQAGRAVAAASIAASQREYALGGHGIKMGAMQGIAQSGLAELTVSDVGKGAFTQLAKFLDSASLESPTRVGDLWAMLPDTRRFPLPNEGDLRPLTVVIDGGHVIRGHNIPITISGIPERISYQQSVPADSEQTQEDIDKGYATERDQVMKFLGRYPSLVDLAFASPEGNPVGLQQGAVKLQWPNPHYKYDERSVVAGRTINYQGSPLAFPSIAGGDKAIHPFVLWWAILFSLSMLSRYEPKAWINRIDVNQSGDAVAIEHLLERALQVVPELIHRTIVSASQQASDPELNMRR